MRTASPDGLPDRAEREARALTHAALACGRMAPTVLGHGPDAVVTTVPPGTPVAPAAVAPGERARWLHALASPIANAHMLVPRPTDLPAWQPPPVPGTAAVPAWTAEPGAWERVLAIARRPPPDLPAVFLHGDWHPGHARWVHAELTAALGWGSACLGPAAVDVARCRTALALLVGPELAEEFLAAYRAHVPGHDQPVWFDAAEAVRLLPDPVDGPLAATEAPRVLRARADAWAAHVAATS